MSRFINIGGIYLNLPLEMLTECHDERFGPGADPVGIIGGQ